MILASGRVVPNWILQLAFELFNENTTMTEVIEDIESIARDDLNVTDRSKLSLKDALEVFSKFSAMQLDYNEVMDEFYEKHGLGHDEYGGDDNDEDDTGPGHPGGSVIEQTAARS